MSYFYYCFALLADDDAPAALAACNTFLERHPRSIGAMALLPSALDGVGRRAQGRVLADFERFLWMGQLNPPPGYASLSDFNRDLADHIIRFPTRPFDPTQTLDLFSNPTGPAAAIVQSLHDVVHHYLEWLPDDCEHPYLSYKPHEWVVDGWGTRMKSMVPMEHHFHQHGWVSGVYYVDLPAFVGSEPAGISGCIEFCRFMQYSSREVDSEFAVLPPAPGMLVLFPSYFYHRVSAFESQTTRISLAFNVSPVA